MLPSLHSLPSKAALATTLSLGWICCFSYTSTAATIYDKDGTSFALYGKVQAAIANSASQQDLSYAGDTNDSTSLYSKVRLGIAGRSAITKGLDALMMSEWETSTDTAGNDGVLDRTRYMFAGIDAYQYGTLVFGKGDGAFYTVAGATDIFNVINSNASDYYLLGDQRPRQMMYSLRALSWDLKLSYNFATNDLGNTPLALERGMAASVSSKFGDKVTFAYGIDYVKYRYNGPTAREMQNFFAPMLAYDKSISLTDAQERLARQAVSTKKEYGLALSYGTFGQDLYAALVLSAVAYDNLAHHLYTVDTAVNYAFANGVSLSLGYGYKTYEACNIVSELSVGAYYDINSAFKLFAEAQFNLGGAAQDFYGIEQTRAFNFNENKFAIGAEFNF